MTAATAGRGDGSVARTELVLAASLLAIAARLGLAAGEIEVLPQYARIGPTVFPFAIVALLAALAVLLGIAAVRGGWRPRDDEAVADRAQTDWAAMAVLAAGFAAMMALLKTAGFVPATAVLFMATAWSFGSRHVLRDLAVAILLPLVAYVGFTKGIGIGLPAGPLEQLIDAAF